jgi:hypothetical protein
MMIDFSTAFRWLNQFDSSRLRVASRSLVEQLDGSVRRYKRVEIQRCIERLLFLARHGGNSDELAEAYIRCGQAAYQINDLPHAVEYLDEAVRLYNGLLHQAAVAQWLRGCALWSMSAPEQYLLALAAWQNSMDRFERMLSLAATDEPRRYYWYREILADMQRTLDARTASLAARDRMMHPIPRPARAAQPRPEPPVQTSSAETPIDQPSSTEPPAQPPEVLIDTWMQEFPAGAENPASVDQTIPVTSPTSSQEPPAIPPPAPYEEITPEVFPVRFQAFNISDLIPAGGFGSLGTDPHPAGYVQIDRFIIDDRIFRIVPLKKNGSVINLSAFLNSGQRFTILHVQGDSMNRTEIQDGDYILVLLKNDARDGDIVVAGPHEEEPQGTLKRLRRRGMLIDLVPESTNPEHPVRTYPADQMSVIISGVALAVLKEVTG